MTISLHIRAAILAVSIGVLGGCASKGPVSFEGTTFLKAPEDFSTAWVTSKGDVYVVPEKGVLLQRITNDAGADVPWKVEGSYLVLEASTLRQGEYTSLWLIVEKRKRRLNLVPEAKR